MDLQNDISQVPSALPAPSIPPIPQSKNSLLFKLALFALLFSLATAGIYLVWTKIIPRVTQKACTMEAKICPDGSSVGRVAPSCDFAPCSTPVATAEPTANWKVYTNSLAGFEVKYPEDWSAINIAAGGGEGPALPNSMMIEISKTIKTETYPQGAMSVQIFQAKPSYPSSFVKSTGIINGLTYEKYSTTTEQQLLSDTYLFSLGGRNFVEVLVRYKNGDSYKEVFDQILFTFKFLEATPSATPQL